MTVDFLTVVSKVVWVSRRPRFVRAERDRNRKSFRPFLLLLLLFFCWKALRQTFFLLGILFLFFFFSLSISGTQWRDVPAAERSETSTKQSKRERGGNAYLGALECVGPSSSSLYRFLCSAPPLWALARQGFYFNWLTLSFSRSLSHLLSVFASVSLCVWINVPLFCRPAFSNLKEIDPTITFCGLN